MKYYNDKTSLKTIFLSTDKEESKGILLVSRETYLALIHAFFGHLYLDGKMILPERSQPDFEKDL